MKLTNNLGLPDSLVAAVSFTDRDREGCDYTITELIMPPRLVALRRQHWDTLEEDASERLWALLGSAGHEVLRRSGKRLGKGIIEERAVVEIGGKKVGGQIDLALIPSGIAHDWEPGEQIHEHGGGSYTTERAPVGYVMTDFKFTSVWAVKEGVKKEWEQQLNCYRWLANQYGVQIDKLQIIALLRDWSKPEARRNPEYPQAGVVILEIPMWTWEETEAWILARIALHEACKAELLECSPEDTWERPSKWAVIKMGNKRATKLHDDPESAGVHQAQLGNAYAVEFRPGERPRCESYCVVAQHCSQYAQWKAANGIAP